MRWLIVQDWKSTHGNHAGMVHMCQLLCELYPEKYMMLVKKAPKLIKSRKSILLKLLIHISFILTKEIKRRKFAEEYISLCQTMFHKLKNGDEIFLLEYNSPTVSQFELAKYVRKKYPFVRIYGLTHMTPLYYSSHYGSKSMIKKWSYVIDKQLTLGSSLSNYMESIGIPHEKISTGFHYVDNIYYKPDNEDFQINEPLTIIAMGSLQRNFVLLANIVKKCPCFKWIICKGKNNIDELFEGLNNVQLVGYVEECDLKGYMSVSDLSLNVLEDTVGSNVITTSMAMGLGLIVSDVGSIRDYCDESNAVFCDNTADSFANEIIKLVHDKNKILSLRKNSLKKSSLLNIHRVDDWFDSLHD